MIYIIFSCEKNLIRYLQPLFIFQDESTSHKHEDEDAVARFFRCQQENRYQVQIRPKFSESHQIPHHDERCFQSPSSSS